MKRLLVPITALCILFATSAVRADPDRSRALAGIPGFDLLVVYANPYDKSPQTVKKSLRDGTVEKLTKAGLPLVETAEAEKIAGRPRLVVLIGLIPEPFCGPSDLYEVEVRMTEEFDRVRHPAERKRHDVWKLHFHGLAAIPDEYGPDMVEHVLYNVDTFIEEFRAANPK